MPEFSNRSTSMLKEFKEFAAKGDMLDMAVGIVIGSAYATLAAAKEAGAVTMNRGHPHQRPDQLHHRGLDPVLRHQGLQQDEGRRRARNRSPARAVGRGESADREPGSPENQGLTRGWEIRIAGLS